MDNPRSGVVLTYLNVGCALVLKKPQKSPKILSHSEILNMLGAFKRLSLLFGLVRPKQTSLSKDAGHVPAIW